MRPERASKNRASAAGSVASKAAWSARRCRAQRPRALQVTTCEDDVGSFGSCQPRGLESDPGAAADQDDGLAEQLRFAQ